MGIYFRDLVKKRFLIMLNFQSLGKSLTFEQSVLEAIDIRRKHKCKDLICEMNIWQTRHQLDMALLKIKHIQRELSYVFRLLLSALSFRRLISNWFQLHPKKWLSMRNIFVVSRSVKLKIMRKSRLSTLNNKKKLRDS